MSEALRTVELPAEAIALIQEGSPRPKAASTILTPKGEVSRSVPVAPSHPVGSVAQTTNGLVADRLEEGSRHATHPRPMRQPEPMPVGGIISITVRVPAEIPARLLRASTDRKLAKVRPCTQQEMVAEALGQWLRKNGY